VFFGFAEKAVQHSLMQLNHCLSVWLWLLPARTPGSHDAGLLKIGSNHGYSSSGLPAPVSATGSGEWYDLYLPVMPAIQHAEPIKMLQHVLTIDFTRRLQKYAAWKTDYPMTHKRSRALEPELTAFRV
jgi:hypothetical protein